MLYPGLHISLLGDRTLTGIVYFSINFCSGFIQVYSEDQRKYSALICHIVIAPWQNNCSAPIRRPTETPTENP